jgi:hypothetical protein
MGAIAAWVTMRDVLKSGKNIALFTATTAVKAGQVVAYNATGVSNAVEAAVSATTARPIGVALYDAGVGVLVAVALDGCVVMVANSDDATTIDAGDMIQASANAVGGFVDTCPITTAGAVPVLYETIGIMLDDVAASGQGRMLISADLSTTANDA